ncbi:MAG: diguanylate cyclase [Actinomycetia bacterium]|nr:diguanylate cyclase [Actinomycetes bacterium]MCP4961215.1 diguanylate cyclase [Actinomycetes bacterium]
MSSPADAFRSGQADPDTPTDRSPAIAGRPPLPKQRPRDLWLRGGFDQASIGLAIIDRGGSHLLVNPAYTALLRRPKSKVVGTRLEDLLAARSVEPVSRWCRTPVQPAIFEVAVDRQGEDDIEAVLMLNPLSGGGSMGHTLVQLVPADLGPTTREKLARFDGVIDHIDDLVVTTRADGTITFVSASTQRATGRNAASLVGASILDLIHPDDHEAITSARRTSRSSVLETTVRVANGSGWTRRDMTITEIRDQLDLLLGLAYVGAAAVGDEMVARTETGRSTDVDTRPSATARVRFGVDIEGSVADTTPRDTSALFEATPDAVWDFDMTGPARANPAARRMLGTGKDLHGVSLLDIHPRWAVERIAKHGVPETRAGRSWSADLALLDPAGEEVPVSLVLIGLPDESGAVNRWTSVSRPLAGDRTDAELRWEATHDHLTGLPSRVLLHDRVEVALARAGRTGQRVGLLLLDLDFFEVVNTAVGTDIADRLLKALAERLVLSIRPGDSIGRMGEDEFVVLCDHFDHLDDAERFAERLLRIVEEPIELDGADWFVSMSVGIAVARPGITTVESLMRNADTAMYRAKELGRGRHVVFGNTLQTPKLPFETAQND